MPKNEESYLIKKILQNLKNFKITKKKVQNTMKFKFENESKCKSYKEVSQALKY